MEMSSRKCSGVVWCGVVCVWCGVVWCDMSARCHDYRMESASVEDIHQHSSVIDEEFDEDEDEE